MTLSSTQLYHAMAVKEAIISKMGRLASNPPVTPLFPILKNDSSSHKLLGWRRDSIVEIYVWERAKEVEARKKDISSRYVRREEKETGQGASNCGHERKGDYDPTSLPL